MTPTKAISIARKRVTLVSYGRNQYVLHRWSPVHNATWTGNVMPWDSAKVWFKEARIREALELLDVEDAGFHASELAHEDGRWDALVRAKVSA